MIRIFDTGFVLVFFVQMASMHGQSKEAVGPLKFTYRAARQKVKPERKHCRKSGIYRIFRAGVFQIAGKGKAPAAGMRPGRGGKLGGHFIGIF
jgi:hypothetical protein